MRERSPASLVEESTGRDMSSSFVHESHQQRRDRRYDEKSPFRLRRERETDARNETEQGLHLSSVLMLLIKRSVFCFFLLV
ncbi:hypothetical protein F2Q68_00045882 [Brassica cretica]|uniref:Uncharacterized protein n=1 Tax=Brassica cretica TaxID=69181 RepID=A0A8S9LNJ8_BRACR|nr:hypothetical protein F2Q68_00045882 [Brassica cretica]